MFLTSMILRSSFYVMVIYVEPFLFSVGVETSEESDISDVDDMCGTQQGWVDPAVDAWDTRQKCNDPLSMDLSQPSSGSNCQRSVILAAALASHRRQVCIFLFFYFLFLL